MLESEFTKPSGKFEENNDGILTFVPDLLPPEIDYATLIEIITEAHRQIGILEGMGNLLPNPDLLVQPYITREAVLSSRIEGTEASIVDAFLFEASKRIDTNEPKRTWEVLNYIKAANHCFRQIDSGKIIDWKLLEDAHHHLLNGVRGQETHLGKVRTVQNWIGLPRCKIQDAVYIPPATHLLDELLCDMIRFVNDPSDEIPVLVRCALAHYQFESIHPFEDGNGRIGRLLILLILADRKILTKPLLYMSSYFERHKIEYYELMRNVSKNCEWIKWIKFFLKGVVECSKEAIGVTNRLLRLKSEYDTRLTDGRASRNAMIITDRLFFQPIVTIPMAAEYIQMGYPPAKKAIMYLVDAGILEQSGSGRRYKTYIAKEILDIFS